MIQHYFLAAWIPPEDQPHRYTTRFVDTERLPRYVVAATSPQVSVPDGQNQHLRRAPVCRTEAAEPPG